LLTHFHFPIVEGWERVIKKRENKKREFFLIVRKFNERFFLEQRTYFLS
jgi:hypothetical protein